MRTEGRNIPTYTKWLAAIALPLLFLALSTHQVHAQTPGAATSFDPAVNPALKGYEYNKSNGPAGQKREGPNGTCVLYNAPGFGAGLETGCLKDGVFTLNGTVVGGTTEQTTQVKRDSEGNTTIATEAETSAAGSAAGKVGKGVVGCVLDPGTCFVNALKYSMGVLVGGVALVLLTIASFLLWIAGGLFNWVVIKTVFEFGSTFGTSGGMLIAWGIIRDIGNIVLLFSFIFMGLATILNTHALDEYSARKALPRLIIFAVLLNFSLFAAQIVIDVSNSFASVFTAQAGLVDCSGNDELARNRCADNGIAGQVIQMAGISSVFSLDDAADFFIHPDKAAPVYIGLTIFITITAVVLLAAAFMLIARAVMLSLLMVLSPIGFAGMAIPPLQEFARSWWKKLLSNAFFAPVYLLLVLISLKILEGLVGSSGNSLASSLINGGMNAPQVFVIFAVVIGFMIASLIAAKSMGAAGADFATKAAGGAVLGTYGYLGRRTIGGAANAWKTRLQSNNALQKKNPELYRRLYGAAKWGTEQSYSVRNLATTLGKGAHLDFGKANKDAAHGFHGIEEKEKKSREEAAKAIKLGEEGNEKLDAIKEAIEEQTKEDKKEAARIKAEQAAERKPLDEEIKQQVTKVKGLREGSEERDAANRELSNLLSQQKTLREEQNEARAEIEKQQKERMAELEEGKKTTENSAKYDYAKALEAKSHNRIIPAPWSPEAEAEHHAAENILKDLKKGKTEKLLESIKDGLDGEGKKKLEEAAGDAKADAH